MKIALFTITIVVVYLIGYCNAGGAEVTLTKLLKTDLDIAKLSGSWYAVYARQNGFRCLGLELRVQNESTIDVDIWNGGKLEESYKLYQSYSDLKAVLERRVYRESGLHTYPWYIIDTDYQRFLSVFHIVTSQPSHNLWAIYARDPNNTVYENILSAVERVKMVTGESNDHMLYFVNNINCPQHTSA